MTEKEKIEMMNLRNRVSNQRDAINKLTEQNERLRYYIRDLEMILGKISDLNPAVKMLYETVKMTA